MTPAEITAYNRGVRTVLDQARHVAVALRRDPARKPTRFPFAADALEEFAAAGEALSIGSPETDDTALARGVNPKPLPAGAAAAAAMEHVRG